MRHGTSSDNLPPPQGPTSIQQVAEVGAKLVKPRTVGKTREADYLKVAVLLVAEMTPLPLPPMLPSAQQPKPLDITLPR
jgi:hypothetical protein